MHVCNLSALRRWMHFGDRRAPVLANEDPCALRDLSEARASELSKRNRDTTAVAERCASLAELNPVTQEILKANTVDQKRDGVVGETAFDLKLGRCRLNKTSIPSKRGGRARGYRVLQFTSCILNRGLMYKLWLIALSDSSPSRGVPIIIIINVGGNFRRRSSRRGVHRGIHGGGNNAENNGCRQQPL